VTATANDQYEADSQTMMFVQDNTVQQDFNLAAGWLVATPAGLEVTLGLGQSKTVSLDLTNNGHKPAAFELQEQDSSFTITAQTQVYNQLHRGGQLQIGDEAKESESELAAVVPAAGAGPDLFGYTYTDSSEPNGPAYQWLEIAPPAGGAGIELAGLTGVDDGYFWPLSLPFSFNFYGTDYNELAIASNGTIYFGDIYLGLENTAIPMANAYGVETFIAPLWDDLYITPGAVYYQATDSMIIIEYYQVSGYFSPDHGTWQVILFENGNTLFQYKDTGFGDFRDNGGVATIGIQGNTTTGLQYAYNEPALADNMAICFAYPGQPADCPPPDVPWLSEEPATGTLAPLTNQTISLTFNAGVSETVQVGQYYAELVIKHDTPYELPNIPVTMNVVSYGLTLEPATDVKAGDAGTTVTHTLWMTNTGLATDTFNVAVSGNGWATTVPATAGPLGPGLSGSIAVAVTIPATAAGNAADVATVVATSQGDSSKSATATLTTIANPIYGLVMAPATATVYGAPGEIAPYTLWITNTGNISDTFYVTASSNWPVVTPLGSGPEVAVVTIGPLAAGTGDELEIMVMVPADAPIGATDIVTVTATSQADSAKSALATLTITTDPAISDPLEQGQRIFLPLIFNQ
jgi:hypothetical protein